MRICLRAQKSHASTSLLHPRFCGSLPGGNFLHDRTTAFGLLVAAMSAPFSNEGSSSFFVYSWRFRIRCFSVNVSFCAFLCFFSLAYSESYERTDTSIENACLTRRMTCAWLPVRMTFTIDGVTCKLLSEFMTEYGAQVPRDTLPCDWSVRCRTKQWQHAIFFNGRLCQKQTNHTMLKSHLHVAPEREREMTFYLLTKFVHVCV